MSLAVPEEDPSFECHMLDGSLRRIKIRSVGLNQTGKGIVSVPGVKIYETGRYINVEGDGEEPFLEYHMSDGRILTEVRGPGLTICLFDGDQLVPGTLPGEKVSSAVSEMLPA